jgi:SAM-dependent methyltransferase
MVSRKRALEVNRKRWDTLVPFHLKSRFYGVKDFKAGKSSLHPLELGEVGDVSRKDLLHLMCHFGMDTLSWARLGASVTGVDYSKEAIRAANGLSRELGIPARFICSDVYDLPRRLKGTFDIVYTSYGVLWWLPDLAHWGRVVARYLRPGGVFHLIESHPFTYLLSQDKQKPTLQSPLCLSTGGNPLKSVVQGSYADGGSSVKMTEYGWTHPLSEVVNALAGAGLRIAFLHEFPFDGWQSFPWLVKGDDGFWHPRDRKVSLPLMFSVKATKPA